jgi:hypothetical protein
MACAIDASGNIFIVGATSSKNLPVKQDAFQTALSLGKTNYRDGFIARMTRNGTQLQALTYYGGEGRDVISDIVVLPDGDILVAGFTNSTLFQTTPDALYPNSHDVDETSREIVLTRFSPGLHQGDWEYCTFFGGSGFDTVASIALGSDGSLYLTAESNSSDIDTTLGAYKTERPGSDGRLDVVVAKFNSSLKKLDYCTYLGGNGEDNTPYCVVDENGRLAVAYTTESTDIDTTPGALNDSIGGLNDTVVQVLSADGSSLLYSSYFGGDGEDIVAGMEIDDDGLIYITGSTSSSDFRFTSNAAYKNRLGVGSNDAFASVFNTTNAGNSSLVYSTVLGGDDGDAGLDLCLDKEEKLLYVLGMTHSMQSLACTDGCYAKRYAGGEIDLFLSIINLADGREDYCSFFGGNGYDRAVLPAHVLQVDDEGHAVFVFETISSNIPTTEGAYCSTFSAGSRAAVYANINPVPCSTFDSPAVVVYEGDGYINISWDLSWYRDCQLLEVIVERGITGDKPQNTVFTTAETNYTYKNTGSTTNGQRWYYWVSVRNTAGKGLPTTFNATAIGPPGPPAIQNISSGDGKVSITWTGPDDWGGRDENIGFNVSRWYGEEAPLRIASGLLPDQQNLTDDGPLQKGRVYWYSIECFNERYNSTWAMASILVYSKPTMPVNLTGLELDREVRLQWEPPADDGGRTRESYILRIYGPGNSTDMVILSASDDDYAHQNLTNGELYKYSLSAYNGREGPTALTDYMSPYGYPTEPLDLDTELKIAQITLRWVPPEDDGGRNVTGYVVRYGTDPEELDGMDTSVNTWWSHFPDPVPGVMYYYSVSAVNARGEGNASTTKGRTYGLVSEPTNSHLMVEDMNISVTWDPPLQWGGALSLNYRLSRKANGEQWEELIVLDNITQYLDEDISLRGGNYYEYRIEANNSLMWGPEKVTSSILLMRRPGPVLNLNISVGPGQLKVTWDPPVDSGGYPIDKYRLVRIGEGTWKSPDLNGTEYVDRLVLHNSTYSYYVVARNTWYPSWGPRCEEESIKVVGRLGPCLNLGGDMNGSKVQLDWLEPEVQEFIEVQGYWIYKGETEFVKHRVATIGNVTSWKDPDIEWGSTYNYWVIPYNKDLTGNATNVTVVVPEKKVENDGIPWLLPLVLAVLAVVAFTVYWQSRGREDLTDEEEPPPDERSVPAPPWARQASHSAGVGTVAAGTGTTEAKEEGILSYIVEEVFVVYNDGRLITSCARDECGTADADLMSGMLIAVQGLIQDGFESGGRLESIKYGENLISLASGDHVVLAAVVYGRPDQQLQDDLTKTVADIEGTYSGIIEDWTGDPSAMEGLDEMVMPLIEGTAYLTRDNVGDVLADHGVALLSAVDFHRGYVRLKMAAVNATYDTVIDSAMEVHYDDDMLRLERVEPDSMAIRGDRVTLGNIKPGERRTVALLFDPQICQSTHIDGHLSYYTSQGELRYVEMKRRTADVVCPVFFTRENANTAMLRKLMKERLHQNDLRLYRYPSDLPPDEVLAICKMALGSDEIQLVREYITPSPTYEAEVWYYAETRVKRYQFVIRLGVVEDKGVVELFAASTAMEPITGLLADFRRELNRILKERYAEDARMVLERDDRLRRDLERRPLRLDSEEE